MARSTLVTVAEIAAHYRVTQKTVRRWHKQQVGVGPLLFRLGSGNHLRAYWEDIQAWDAEQRGGVAA